jgi:hypothetical protein
MMGSTFFAQTGQNGYSLLLKGKPSKKTPWAMIRMSNMTVQHNEVESACAIPGTVPRKMGPMA